MQAVLRTFASPLQYHWARLYPGSAVAILALALMTVSIVVITHPEIDLQLSLAFYQAGIGFPLAQDANLQGLRWLGRALPAVIVTLLLAAVVVRICLARPSKTCSDRAFAFLLGSFAIGPGLIVNGLLKSHWGRPRPLVTDLFGGTAQFTPAWWPWGECVSNCSFVSGEASTAAVLMAFALIAPHRYRAAIAAAVTVWMIVVSLNRMAFGAHYFSDVVVSCLLTLTIVYALKALLMGERPAA